MPNWCSNTLIITGDEKLLETFYNENRAGEDEDEDDDQKQLSFNKAIPIEIGDNKKWYELFTEKWGTTSDAFDVCCDEIGGFYEFKTAWSPPTEWFEAVVKKYPELHFELRYSEPGSWFSGYFMAEDGEIYEEREGGNGEYHGTILCEYCNYEFALSYLHTDYHECICDDCLGEKKNIITNAVRNIKIKRLPFKNACNRISRNPIFDQFLMRKVFVKRVEEIF